MSIRASVGVSRLGIEDVPLTVDELLVRSDLAMYSAKRSGNNQGVTYCSGPSVAEVEEQELRDRLCARSFDPDVIAVGPDEVIPVT